MKLFEIPDLDLTHPYSFFSKMFSINKNFQVANNRGKVFELKDGKPIENVKLKNVKYLYSFANHTIVWRSDDRIERLENDFSFKKICDCKDIDCFSFCGGGIAVFENYPFTKAIVVDLVNMKSFETT